MYTWCLQERGECQDLILLERNVFFLGWCEKAVCGMCIEFLGGVELLVFSLCPSCGLPRGGKAPVLVTMLPLMPCKQPFIFSRHARLCKVEQKERAAS